MNTPRIAIFTTSLSTGGAQRIAVNLSNGLSEAGFEVELVLVDATGRLREEVIPGVEIVDLSARRVLTAIPKLTLYLVRSNPDIIYSMMPHNNTAAYIAHKLAKSNACFVPSEHNMPTADITTYKDVLLLAASIPVHQYADHTIAVSNGVRNELARIAQLDEDDISVLYNPIVTDEINQTITKPVDHPWFSEAKIVMSAGRHVKQKGFDTLIKAFRIVRETSNDDVRLVIFGEGPETDNYRRIAAENGIKRYVDFPGFIDNIFSAMASADVFVLSSRWEGFGNVLVEAMACGTQVVATDCQSGPAEILENGKYGELVAVDEPDSIAQGVVKQLESGNYPVIERANDFRLSTIIPKYEQVFANNCA